MIHYTCDRCKQQISASQSRYVVQMEVRAARDDSFSEFADEVDHLTELNEILESSDTVAVGEPQPSSHHNTFDLCPECHEQFVKNPLGKELHFALGFSNN